MLSQADNERLTRVGRGTPAGELFRRYWQPALLSSELPENDGAPVRVRLLAEDLIAFRDSSGKVGLVEAFCPHRRAPMFFGRNEEQGLRCVYHGWKFDHTGACVDMPSEPAGTPMKDRVRIGAYPTVEKAGIVWTYMGPKDAIPEAPDCEFTRTPDTHRHVSKTYEACNYLQGLEGGLDTGHSSFLHSPAPAARPKNALDQRLLEDRAPVIEVFDTDYGYSYSSTRKSGPDKRYVRIYHFMLPNHVIRSMMISPPMAGEEIPRTDAHLWVPIDDENTYVYNYMYSLDTAKPFSQRYADACEGFVGRGPDDLIPGTFKLKQNASNDYLIDRQVQKTQTFTGIKGINTQDFALQENMGRVVDRMRENLGTSDRAVVAMRRLLLEASHAVERGQPPRGVDTETYRRIRPYDEIIPVDQDWRKSFAGKLVAQW